MLFVILSEEMMGAVSGRTTTCTTTSSRQNWPSKATSRSAPSRPGRVAGIAARYKKTGLRLKRVPAFPGQFCMRTKRKRFWAAGAALSDERME